MCEEYNKKIADSRKLMPDLEGKILRSVCVQIVQPEFNGLYLETDAGCYAIQGEVGSEILGIRTVGAMPSLVEEEWGAVRSFSPYFCFIGKRIKQVRMIGDAWNGHGFEISFEGILDRTMLVQSIYAGEKPEQYDDCIRLGVGIYYWDSERQFE